MCSLAHSHVMSAEITNAHSLRAPVPYHGKDLWISLSWGKLKKENFNVGRLKLPLPKGRSFLIEAVATIEPKSVAAKPDKCMDLEPTLNPHPPPGVLLDAAESEQLHEREKLRRMRISKANKGNTPWNKGRKHSPGNLSLLALLSPHFFLYLVVF